MLFFAQTEYLKRNEEFKKDKFLDWMRVIRNIVSRADIDKDGKRPDIIRSPLAFDGVINLINELAEGSNDIYNFLSKYKPLNSRFAAPQIQEERNKASLIISNPDYKKDIFQAEDIELLRGKIDILFYCMDYNFDPYKLNIEEFNISEFNKYKEVLAKYFNNESLVNNDIRRAFLTIKVDNCYEFYNYWWSSWTVMSADKRRLFDKPRELEYYISSQYKEYFKKLVIQLIDKSPTQITQDFSAPCNFPNWKKRLIKEPQLLDDEGKSNYIAILPNNEACYILKSKRPREIEGNLEVR